MMFRQNSSNQTPKWKQVLGFDDGSPARQPTYNPPPSPPYSLHSSYTEEEEDNLEQLDQLDHFLPLPPARSQKHFPKLPRDVTFTRTVLQDILLAATSPAPAPDETKPLPDPPPLLYFNTQQDTYIGSNFTTPRPDLILYSGPSVMDPMISFASFELVTKMAEITLCPLPPSGPHNPFTGASEASTSTISSTTSSLLSQLSMRSASSMPVSKTEKLIPVTSNFTTERYSFHLTLPRTSVREKFEWRHSSGPFMRNPTSRTEEAVRESSGLKLVRCVTGDVVAVFAGSRENKRRVIGMLKFLGKRLGEEFEVFVAVSVMSIVERGRRTMEANRAAMAHH